MLYAETARLGSKSLDVVVKKLGKTAAHEVRVRVTPELTRALGRDDTYRKVQFPEEFPVLVPGQSWRTLWDSAVRRHESSLPSRHIAEVSFKDSSGTTYSLPFVLDWEASVGRMYIETLGEHDAAKALREISMTVASCRKDVLASQ